MRKRLLAMAGALALSLSLILPTAAEDTGTVLYEQDFEDGTSDIINTLPENNGTSEIVEENGNKFLKLTTNNGDEPNGYLQFWGPYEEGSDELALDMTGDWDYTLRVRPDYIKNPDHNWIKICVNAQDGIWENACYMFEMWQWRGKIAVKDQAAGLDDLNNPVVEGMENEDLGFSDGIWYSLKISRRGNTISVYVNDQLNVYMTDEDSRFDGGTIVFCSWGANFSVDDLKVVGYEGDGPDPTPTTTTQPTSAAPSDTDAPDGSDAPDGTGSAGQDDGFTFPWVPVVVAAAAVIVIGGGIIAGLAVKQKQNRQE